MIATVRLSGLSMHLLNRALTRASLRLRRGCLLTWFVLATLALLLPLPESWHSLEQQATLPLDKLAHLLGTLVGAMLAHWAGWRPTRNLLVWTVYAAGMEGVQGATGYRAADGLDFVAALGGLVLGLGLAAVLLPATGLEHEA
ncbi:hypothetical protein BURK2_04012 [Burkholderiales bacterium]|nr:MAG: hypothetical protein F9K47_09305 [Burkholderiales bacterium]CAG1010297.1 hypothetical protein BURK2_04012 [Burkholderiales bacterium]